MAYISVFNFTLGIINKLYLFLVELGVVSSMSVSCSGCIIKHSFSYTENVYACHYVHAEHCDSMISTLTWYPLLPLYQDDLASITILCTVVSLLGDLYMEWTLLTAHPGPNMISNNYFIMFPCTTRYRGLETHSLQSTQSQLYTHMKNIALD